jgi:hypothetical protein
MAGQSLVEAVLVLLELPLAPAVLVVLLVPPRLLVLLVLELSKVVEPSPLLVKLDLVGLAVRELLPPWV